MSELSPELRGSTVEVTVRLADGEICEMELPADSAILRELFETLTPRSRPPGSGQPKLIRVPTRDNRAGAYSFSSTQVVAITTTRPALANRDRHFEALQILGPYHSGTCLLFNYQRALYEVHTAYHYCCWKHSLPPTYQDPPTSRDSHPINEKTLRETLFVCMVRLPYFWILSTLRETYGAIAFEDPGDNFGTRLRSPIRWGDETFGNIVEFWNAYYRAYQTHLAPRAPVQYVRLEDLVQTPQRVIETLDQHLERKPTVDIQATIDDIANRPAKVHGRPCVYGERARREYVPENVPKLFEVSDLRFINRNLDAELMHRFHYAFA